MRPNAQSNAKESTIRREKPWTSITSRAFLYSAADFRKSAFASGNEGNDAGNDARSGTGLRAVRHGTQSTPAPASSATSFRFARAPTACHTGSPSRNTISVGVDSTP